MKRSFIFAAGFSLALMSNFLSADELAPARAKFLPAVQKVLQTTPVIDGHNDTPWQYRKLGNEMAAIDLSKDTGAVKPYLGTDIPRLRKGGLGGQFWSVYIPPTMGGTVALRAVMEQIDVVHRMCARYPKDFELALTAADIERISKQGKIASLIGMEGGHSIDNSLAMLRMLYQLGARYMTLTHTKTLDWADAAGDVPKSHGLSPFGVEVVGEMNRLGMLVDISHVSDETMRAALQASKAPVIFSHSSCRVLCNHERNVPDDVLKLLPANGGVMMVNFMPGYLTERKRLHSKAYHDEEKRLEALHTNDVALVQTNLAAWEKANPEPARANLVDIADHIQHVRDVAGIDYVGIGSDFEGFDGNPEGMEDVSHYPDLLAELMRRGFSEAEVAKVAGGNILRVMHRAEAVAKHLQEETPVK